jgi:predicted Zn-dependent protease
VLASGACTVSPPAPVSVGTIPPGYRATLEAREFGQQVLEDLEADHGTDTASAHYALLSAVLEELAAAADLDPATWQVHLLDDCEVVDVRAVYGNYLFVWSGLFRAVESEDELAGLIAVELAHGLAAHTDPVRFTRASELLFSVTDVVASLGVAVLTQGIVAISAPGMTRWAYLEARDLGALDRRYTPEEERESAQIALSILGRSVYRPEALLGFWERVARDEELQAVAQPLVRGVPARDRVTLLASTLQKGAGLGGGAVPR